MSANSPSPANAPSLFWEDTAGEHRARWLSDAGNPPPARVLPVDDTLTADAAFRLTGEGTALLWGSDYHNARTLLSALTRRLDKRAASPRAKGKPGANAGDLNQQFHRYRMAQAQRTNQLGKLLVPLSADHRVLLPRAPDVADACRAAWGDVGENYVVSLRELLGAIGAFEWRKRGVPIPAIGASIHPHYGVFSPVRGEYIALVAQAPLPAALAAHPMAMDIGTGTGVLAAVLARRGVAKVLATDQDPRALACARENIARLQLEAQIDVVPADLFAPGVAALIVCNPPWLPGKPASRLDHAIYDPDSRMLRGFIAGLRAHLAPGGEGWLILSDLAEHLGLRTRAQLQGWIDAAGLRVLDRIDARPEHPRAADATDPLHVARSREVTSLWRLTAT
ncbi:MAG TPA: class I SAM-dependent methyltransferase [Burkholderiaceae bacterium]|nr:class I SAM-dependent methyltransferase [Burkholderiaceae bacterium]